MITIPINTNYRFKFPVIDQATGKFVTGLTIAYSLVKTSDGTVVDSGNCSEVGATGLYYFNHTFAVAQEYDVIISTPVGYYDGFETIMVEEAVDVSASLTSYGVAKTSDIEAIPAVDLSEVAKTTELQAAAEAAIDAKNVSTLESTGAQIEAFQ